MIDVQVSPRTSGSVCGSEYSLPSDVGDTTIKSNYSESGLSLRSFITSYSAHYTSENEPSNVSRESYSNPVVAAKEQKAVFMARLVVVAVLIIVLSAITATMYWVVSANEQAEFKTQVRTQEDSE